MAVQFHRPDLNEGMVLAWRRPQSRYVSVEVALHGLVPTATYELRSESGRKLKRRSGAALMQLRHPYQASVGQRHRHALVAAEQLPHSAKFAHEAKVRDEQSALQKLQQSVGATMRPLQEEKSFTQRRIAGP
jgi:hypothetical protein